MKIQYIIIFCIVLCVLCHFGSTGQNIPGNLPAPISSDPITVNASKTKSHILTYSYLKPFTVHPTSLKVGDSFPAIEYFDGLGKSVQRVEVRSSASGSDVVSLQTYDQSGNLERQWLPYAKANNNGSFVNQTDFQSGQSNLLTGYYGSTDGSKGYAVTVYEKSPQGRVEKQGSAGAAWQTGTGDKPVKYGYRTNVTSDSVRTWKYNEDTFSAFTYPAGSLWVKETTDEDGRPFIEFRDQYGRLVMGKAGNSRTRYCYDQYGRVRCVVQPEGTSPADTDNCFYYKYDERGRLTDKKVPVSNWTYFIYDGHDRLVLTQDGNQRFGGTTPVWTYTLYDQLKRPIEQGIWETTLTRTTLEGMIEASLTYMSGVTARVPLKYYHYSDYVGCPVSSNFHSGDANALSVTQYGNSTGRLTWTQTRILEQAPGMDQWITAAFYYDTYGRLIQTVKDNHLNGADYITNKYNFVGQVIQTRHRHVADGVTTYTDLTSEYDHRGRRIKSIHSINGANTITLDGNIYDETGNLARQLLYSEDLGITFLQKNDYTYNIRGWLTQMNDPAQLTEGDKFGMKLDYNMATSPGTAMFNGNISGFTWSTATLNQARYVYTYDDQNRMTYANYASTQDAGSFNVSVAYNANGNITYLQRKSSGIASDNLDFTYRGNRVTGIRDLAQDKPMVVDYPGGTTFYPLVYDSSGNVVLEPHKQLEIRYNLHNLPSEIIRIGQNQRIRYYYTFDGLKLARQYEDNGTVTGTDYCGPFVYETVSGVRSLKYIVTPHGRAIKNGSLWTREFNLRDHLGNVRVVIRKGGNGQAEIVQQKGYYPFGGEISQFSTGTGTNRHWYNGKELQDDLNLYWYDYGARFYDPELGRFSTADRFSEKYYSLSNYGYAANNPIKYIDVNGDSIWIQNKREQVLYESGKLFNKDGSAYTGKVKGFLKQTKGALDQINGVSSGKALVNQLQGSKFNFTIQRGNNGFNPSSVSRAGLSLAAPAYAAMAGSGGTINFNPSRTASGPNQLGNLSRPGFIGIAHEMGHASMAEQGMANYSIYDPTNADPNLRQVTNDEFNAVNVENQVRSEYGLPLRDFYTQDASGAGFMRFLIPATSVGSVSGVDYSISNPVQVPYVGPNSGR